MAEKSTKAKSKSKKEEPEDSVCTYRGYRITSSEFVTAMVHFFRAEVSRANVWRQRLDTTTNWAVVATAATLSIAFNQAESNHAVIIMNTMLVTLFLYIEARRYRYYELWSYRVRLMETDFYAAMLVPPAVALCHGERATVRLSETQVWFRSLDDDLLARYADSGEPLDKAGGYGIQGRAGAFVRRIEGSYSGIMGLPLYETARMLRGVLAAAPSDVVTGVRAP